MKGRLFDFGVLFFLIAAFLLASQVGAYDEGIFHIPEETERVDFETILLCDWLYQDLGTETGGIFTDKAACDKEQTLVKKVLASILAESAAQDIQSDGTVIAKLESEMDQLVHQQVPGDDPRWLDLYKAACEVRRAGRLAVVREESPILLFTKHCPMGSGHYAYTEDVSDAQYIEHYDRCLRVPGGALCKGTLGDDNRLAVEDIITTATGVIRDPDVSYDGKKAVFSMRNSFDNDDYHLFDWNVETGEIRQITKGLGFADYEPVYLPDDSLIFLSTRCMQMIDCWWTDASNFYACDGDGRYVRRIGFDQVTVNYPKMTEDGRIIYTRWDYNDRGHIYPQGLFVMNPDGTGQTAFYGNNSWFPTAILQSRVIPGTSGKVMAVIGGHHCIQRGKLGILDRTNGTEENEGCQLIAPIRETPAVIEDEYGQEGDQFNYPYPFDEENFLVSYRPEKGDRSEGLQTQFGLYWMNPDGDRELLAWDYDLSCGQPIPLAEREKPIVRSSTVDYRKHTGRYYVQDVYEGPGLAGVERGTVKSLRVVALEFRAAQVYEGWNTGEAGSTTPPTPIGCDNCTWDIKHVLGEVPVEEDGSAFFEVPANTPVYFQLLDGEGNMVQSMRSWSTLMPNEFFACVGCHEPKSATMNNLETLTENHQTLALQKGAAQLRPITPKYEGIGRDWGFSFNRDVQPILDAHCTDCHTGGTDAAGKPAPFSLLANDVTEIPSCRNWCNKPEFGRVMTEAYLNLTENGQFEHYIKPIPIQNGPQMIPPYQFGSAKSRLIELLRHPDAAHQNLAITEPEIKILAAWIDLLVPFCGSYDQEAANWDDRAKADYAYNLMKRHHIEAIEQRNIEKMLAVEDGADPEPFDQIEQPSDFGREFKANFTADYPRRKHDCRTKKSGAENVYRNIALNPDDVQGETLIRPHAASNSEYRYQADYAAKNILDGKAERFWMPNHKTDAWLDIDFGHRVVIDKIVITLANAEPVDGYYSRAAIQFSDGSTETITLQATDEPQEFTFAKRTVSSIRLKNFGQEMPLRYHGISEIEVWGISEE